MTATMIDPKQHDTKLAKLYFDLARAQHTAGYQRDRIIYSAGVVARRWGKETKRGWGSEEEYFSLEEAVAILGKREDRDSNIYLTEYEQTIELIKATAKAIEDAEDEYTGWSRFFVVTSSQGHIHNSMFCTSCYRTTTYGWLPELSGKTEAEAVAAHGPALCTVCFPSAPVEDTGYKITQTHAQELAWSPDREKKIARREADQQAKAEAKLKKAANKIKRDESLAHKVNYLVDEFGKNRVRAYRWTWDHKGYDNAYFAYSDMIKKGTRCDSLLRRKRDA